MTDVSIPAARSAPAPAKPLLRGVSHQLAFFAALAGAAALLYVAGDGTARAGAAVYGASLVTLFGVSALYHRRNWAPAPRTLMRKLDHSAIFLLIAGTFTPFCLALDERARTLGLALVWGGAALGIAQSLFWVHAPKWLVAAACVLLAWSMTPLLARAASPRGLALLLLGGVLYSAGAAIYAAKRPDPAPAIFGYHEIFHALVIAGSACHYAAVVPMVRALQASRG